MTPTPFGITAFFGEFKNLGSAAICSDLSLLFLTKGDSLDQRNWRAISLLNIDYKVCARALAGRLLKVLHHVVSPDQTYDIPGYLLMRMFLY